MKSLISFIAILVAFSAFSQQVYNTSCASAEFVSGNTTSQVTSYTNQPNCIQGTGVQLYFYYRAEVNFTGSIMSIACNNGGSQNFTYAVYGPFDSQDLGCTALAGSPVALTSGNQSSNNVNHQMIAGKYYILKLTNPNCTSIVTLANITSNLNSVYADQPCLNCVKLFHPEAGEYIISAWVKDANASAADTTYKKPEIRMYSGANINSFKANGQIIDGWQRIEQKVYLDDASLAVIKMRLLCESGGDCYFDDIRLFPNDGSMVSYVYDPLTLRLVAELDERNFAKLYEYDEQGKLVRVKKETEKGVMTIQETRENNAGNE
jgi:hypothetical protein